jgi:hypothetical protein
MNGDVFRGLHNLKEVYLQSNQCTNSYFLTEAAIAKMPEVLSQNCGFCEKIADLTSCDLQSELKGFEKSLIEKLESGNESVAHACRENLKANQELKTKIEGIYSAHLIVQQKLVEQMEETLAAKTENLQGLIQKQVKEIAALRSKLDASQSDNNAKNFEIKHLKLKLELLEEISN